MHYEFQNLPPSSPGYELVYEERCMAKANNMFDRMSCTGDSMFFVIFIGIIGLLLVEYILLHKHRKRQKHRLHQKKSN